jgi:anti-sigma28 factor (negative regulator of flagellin synthesis)
MRIYDQNLTGTTAAETGQAQKTHNPSRAGTDTSPARSGVDGSSNDRVEFSGTMSRLSRALSTFESTRANRVQALTTEYQSGKYKPDPAATSKGLVDEGLSAGLQ